jgi:hypothetical protein
MPKPEEIWRQSDLYGKKEQEKENPISDTLADLIIDILKRNETLIRRGEKAERVAAYTQKEVDELLNRYNVTVSEPETLRRIKSEIDEKFSQAGGSDIKVVKVNELWKMIEKTIEKKVNIIGSKNETNTGILKTANKAGVDSKLML